MRRLIAVLLVLAVSACGTTSAIQPVGIQAATPVAGGATAAATVAHNPYRDYNRVAVLDFNNATGSSEASDSFATRMFADMIAAEIKKRGSFAEITREKPEGESLVISGDITRYDEGSAALRLLIGLGAGSSYFDAMVRLTDNVSGAELGVVTVDKNSWGLGGALASAQTTQSFMEGAAESIAEDLQKLKAGEQPKSD